MRSASVQKLVTKRELATRDQASSVATMLMALPANAAPAYLVQRLLNELHRNTRPDGLGGIWPGGFVMLGHVQMKRIWDAIRDLPAKDRPGRVRHVFDLVLLNLRPDTGEVMLTRDELANEVGCDPHGITQAMAVLRRLGVITSERRRIEGMRGLGVVAYFINPHAAWEGDLNLRREVVDRTDPPLLTLMEGGRS